jgi:hypothetical protein
MRALHPALLGITLFLATPTFAASPFDGTWRPDPERGDPNGARNQSN